MHIIIQGHGFNSGPGKKAESLQKAFPKARVLAPQLSYDPAQAYATLAEIFQEHPEDFIQYVGTSLGGFYGLCLAAKFNETQHFYYLINTSLQPQLSLRSYLNTTVTNFKTMERQYIDKDMLDRFATLYRKMYAGLNGKAIQCLRIFEGSEDDLIDHSLLRQFLKSYESPLVISTHERDHRFEDITPVIDMMAIDAEQFLSIQDHT